MRFQAYVALVAVTNFCGCEDEANPAPVKTTPNPTGSNGIAGTRQPGPFGGVNFNAWQPQPVIGSRGVRRVFPNGHVYVQAASLGKGAAGEVVLVRREHDGQIYAMKRTQTTVSSRREVEAHQAVLGLDGFPQIVDSFEDAGYTYMVLSRLGPSIETIRSFGGKLLRLSHETIGSIGLHMVDRLETLHGRGFVHLDMYPNNIAVGDGDSGRNKLFLFDFGEARRYIDAGTGEIDRSLVKTRKFDIQSLSHSILQLLKPGTPYGDFNHYEDAGITLETLCEGLPNAVLRLFKYSHETLGLHESPDYSLLRSLLRELVPDYTGTLIWN